MEAVRLIRDLEVGRATDRLLSLGLGDIRIAEVLAQAENKHPQRQDDVLPDPMDYFGAAAPEGRLEFDVVSVLEDLKRRKGAGPSGLRGEHLRALTYNFEVDSEASRGVQEYKKFAEHVANSELPSWFYALLTMNRLVMPLKKIPEPGDAPDCRPVGVPNPDRCAIERAVFKSMEEAHATYLSPEQLGVGVKGGIAILIHGLRLMMSIFPDFVFVSLDTRNAHNEFCRHKLLLAYAALFQRMADRAAELTDAKRRAAGEALARLVKYIHSHLGVEARVVKSGTPQGAAFLENRSSKGGGSRRARILA